MILGGRDDLGRLNDYGYCWDCLAKVKVADEAAHVCSAQASATVRRLTGQPDAVAPAYRNEYERDVARRTLR